MKINHNGTWHEFSGDAVSFSVGGVSLPMPEGVTEIHIWSGGGGGAPEASAIHAAVDSAIADGKDVYIDYTNHRGERRVRPIRPLGRRWGHDAYHKPDQYLLDAVDTEIGSRRVFAISQIHEIGCDPERHVKRK